MMNVLFGWMHKSLNQGLAMPCSTLRHLLAKILLADDGVSACEAKRPFNHFHGRAISV